MRTKKGKTIEINDLKLNTFNRLKLFNCEKINKIFDKNLSYFNKLSKELFQLSSFNDNAINETFEINDKTIKNNKINRFILKKIKLIKKKDIQYNRINNKKFLKNKFFSLEKINKKNYIKKKDDTSFLRNYFSPFNKTYNSLSNKSIKKKENNIKQIKSKNITHIIKKNISENSNILLKRNNLILSSDENNKYKNNLKYNIFITLQKSEENHTSKKIKNENKKKESIIYSYKNALKNISNENITNFINESKSLYDSQISKLKKNNTFLNSGRKNFYAIKNLLQKFDMSQDIEKELEYKLYEDIDIKKIHKELKHFSNSFKEKISFNKKDISKSVLISKKSADIVNYCDYFSKMNDIYFYKYNKAYINNYPVLSQIARKEPFNRDYKKITYNSHKKTIEENASNIRHWIKICKRSINKINQL